MPGLLRRAAPEPEYEPEDAGLPEDRIRARISSAINRRAAPEPVLSQNPITAAIQRREPPVTAAARSTRPQPLIVRPHQPQPTVALRLLFQLAQPARQHHLSAPT